VEEPHGFFGARPQAGFERPPQLLYSFEEAGAILSVSGRQMQILVRQGLIPSVRIGRLVQTLSFRP